MLISSLSLPESAAQAPDTGPSTPLREIPICHDFSCKVTGTVTLDATDWQRVRQRFLPTAGDPATERRQIAAAIALLEQISGLQTGTSADRGGNTAGSGLPGQMDCIDESTNTTTYLHLLESDGLLRWHRVAARQRRAPLIFNVHWTAVITEKPAAGQPAARQFAVDSWFHDNGEEPEVIPLRRWRSGWKP